MTTEQTPKPTTETKAKKAPRVQKTEDEILQELEKKIAQVKANFADRKARELAKASKGSSAQETKKKILIGAFLLNHHSDINNLAFGDVRFVDFLVRNDDRKLFGLEPLKTASVAPVVDAAPTPATKPTPAPAAAVAPTPKPATAATRDVRTGNVYLNVEMAEKDAAKALGARWDNDQKKWFVPAGVDVSLFKRWLN